MLLTVDEVLDSLNSQYYGKVSISLEKNCFTITDLVSSKIERIQRNDLIDIAYSLMCEEKFNFESGFSAFKLAIKDICLNLVLFGTENICEIKEVNGYED